MKNLDSDGIKVKFFIPGRIRLVISLLYKNKFLATKILNATKNNANIDNISINTNTSNLIIKYNYQKISEVDLKKFIEISLKPFLKTNSSELKSVDIIAKEKVGYSFNKSIYANERAISKRLISGLVFVIGAISISSFNIASIISIIILAPPFILFYIKKEGYRITSDMLSKRNIKLNSDFIIKHLSEVDEIYIQDDVILDKSIVGINTNFMKNSVDSIERLIIYGELQDPIFLDSKILIKNLRNIGINKIFLVSKQTNECTEYAKDVLGIKLVNLEDGYVTDFSQKPLTTIIVSSKINDETNGTIVIHLCGENNEIEYDDKKSLQLCKKDILELPYSILLCKYMETTVSSTQNIGLTINIIGLIFSISKYIFIRGSIMIVLLNFLFSRALLTIGLKKNNLTVFNSLN